MLVRIAAIGGIVALSLVCVGCTTTPTPPLGAGTTASDAGGASSSGGSSGPSCAKTADCIGKGQNCVAGACKGGKSCASDKDCASLDAVCFKEASVCVDCLVDPDCGPDGVCLGKQCKAKKVCASSKECAASGQVCHSTKKVCVGCEADADCGKAEFCLDGACKGDLCTTGETKCKDEATLLTCKPNGSGFGEGKCGDKQLCKGAGCVCKNENRALPDCGKCKPKFKGENCDQCADAKFTGTACDQCADPKYTGEDCDKCANPKFKGALCDQCADPKFKGADCDQCANPMYKGAKCDQCADPKFKGKFCDECVDPKFKGSACDECTDPKFKGEKCDQCADPKFKGSKCDECADPKFKGEKCDQCVDPKFKGEKCDECADPKAVAPSCSGCKPQFTGDKCDKCANPKMALPGCTTCKPKFTGKDCSECADPKFQGENCDKCADPKFTGPKCDTCTPKFKGSNCDQCVDPKFTGSKCDQCADPKFKGAKCDQCADPKFKGTACDQCADAKFKGATCDQCTNSNALAPTCDKCKPGFGGPTCKALGFKQVTVGDTFSCGLLTSGKLKCWGNDKDKQVSGAPNFDAPYHAIASGAGFSCAQKTWNPKELDPKAKVRCWGTVGKQLYPPDKVLFDRFGLGLGFGCGQTDSPYATGKGRIMCWGNKQHNQIKAPSAWGLTHLAVGRLHACVFHPSTKTAFCWGRAWGPLDNLTNAIKSPKLAQWVTETGDCVKDNPCTYKMHVKPWSPLAVYVELKMKITPPPLPLADLSCGGFGCCGIDDKGALVCGTTTVDTTSIGGTLAKVWPDHVTPVAKTDLSGGALKLSGVTALSSGVRHGCAVAAGKIHCWGDNAAGQAKPPTGPQFVSISAGLKHSCGVTTTGEALCWGANDFGQTKVPTP